MNNPNLNNKIFWYDIDYKGCIEGKIKNEAGIYIYMLTQKDNFYYVGSSIKLLNRYNSHRFRVNNWNKNYHNNNGSLLFYNSVLTYGWKNFKFGVLEYINKIEKNDIKEVLLKKEQLYLDKINPTLNICKIAGSPLGIKHGFIFSKNLSEARRGKKNNIKKSEVTKSKFITSETKSKLSSRSTGIKVKIYDKLNNLVNEFPTMTAAAKHKGVSDRTMRRILNTGVSYDNFRYEFEVPVTQNLRVLNNNDNITKTYYSLRELAKDIKVNTSSIRKYINTDKLLNNIYLIKKKY